MKLIIDNRNKNQNTDLITNNSSKSNALNSLELLDGIKHTLLSLERADGWRMDIGGGDGNYIVSAVSSSTNCLTLINPDGDYTLLVELCAGGQYAEFPHNIVVTEILAKNAICNFFDKSENKLNWES